MSTLFGTDNDDKILQKNFPSTKQDATGQWTMQFQYMISKELAYDPNIVPNQNTSVPPEFAEAGITDGLILLTKNYTVPEIPGFFLLELNYALQPSDSIGTALRPGDITLEANTTFREIPIEAAQNADGDELSPGEIAAIKAAGESTKSAFQVVFIETTVEKSGVITEEELITLVGKINNPPNLSQIGETYPEEEKQHRWLCSSLGINTIQGGNRQVRKEWTYDESNWDDLLYEVVEDE